MEMRDMFDRPAMARRLLICTGPCCDRLGLASAHLEDLRALLRINASVEPSIGNGSCVRRSCLGKCSGEPLAYVQPDDVWYHDLSPENLLRIYEQHVLNGRPVDDLVLSGDG
jgi:(2Fe-2S) ferredoxin